MTDRTELQQIVVVALASNINAELDRIIAEAKGANRSWAVALASNINADLDRIIAEAEGEPK